MDTNSPSPQIIGSAIVCTHPTQPQLYAERMLQRFGDMIFIRSGEIFLRAMNFSYNTHPSWLQRRFKTEKRLFTTWDTDLFASVGSASLRRRMRTLWPSNHIVHKVMARSTPAPCCNARNLSRNCGLTDEVVQLFSHEPRRSNRKSQPFPVTTLAFLHSLDFNAIS